MKLLARIGRRLWTAKPVLRSTDDYIVATATAQAVHGHRRVLLVGDAGGRDWRHLSELGHEVWMVDIAPQVGFPRLVVQSIEERTPFDDHEFDAVVMNEVLEHLWDDVRALKEVRRVLRPDGALAITVPYLHDMPEYHVRVHTPRTIRRLLERAGFQVESQWSRGVGPAVIQRSELRRAVIYGLQALVCGVLRVSPDRATDLVNGPIARTDHWIGTHAEWVQRRCASYGGQIVARPAEARDFATVQVSEFADLDHHRLAPSGP